MCKLFTWKNIRLILQRENTYMSPLQDQTSGARCEIRVGLTCMSLTTHSSPDLTRRAVCWYQLTRTLPIVMWHLMSKNGQLQM